MQRRPRILALSGSLRALSTNTALIEAARRLGSDRLEIERFADLASLPLFNPDLEHPDGSLPAPVRAFRDRVASCDGLMIASPEYAHGMTGVLKNALDWLVSGPEFPGKPIALFRATPRGHHAHESLCEVLRTMSGVLVEAAGVTVPLLGTIVTAEEIVGNPAWAAAILAGLDRFASELQS